jgi:hypothetical protein
MAVTVNEEKTIKLLNGTEVSARPLKISLLREFMKKFDGLAEVADNNDKSMDILIECVGIALKQYAPDLVVDAKGLEDLVDLPTVYQIIEAASGIDMTGSVGPNL